MEKEKRKIVVVDDLKVHLLSIQGRFKDHYDIFPAGSSGELFEILEMTVPELILLDINMPDVDGYDMIKMLKSDSRFAGLPVVFLTTQNDRESIIKGMRLGAADFLSKPFSDSILIKCIENICDPEKQASRRPVILAVDDNLSILKSINHLLSDLYDVRTLPKPEDLEELICTVKPDLFLLDYNMPVLSGFELVPVIRAFPDYAETPIICLTSDGTVNLLSEAVQLGASDFIVKPVDETILRTKIAQHLKDFMLKRRIRSAK